MSKSYRCHTTSIYIWPCNKFMREAIKHLYEIFKNFAKRLSCHQQQTVSYINTSHWWELKPFLNPYWYMEKKRTKMLWFLSMILLFTLDKFDKILYSIIFLAIMELFFYTVVIFSSFNNACKIKLFVQLLKLENLTSLKISEFSVIILVRISQFLESLELLYSYLCCLMFLFSTGVNKKGD